MSINHILDEVMEQLQEDASEAVGNYSDEEYKHHALNWLRDFAPASVFGDWIDWMEQWELNQRIQDVERAYADNAFERLQDEDIE
jgi:hypothetical protein